LICDDDDDDDDGDGDDDDDDGDDSLKLLQHEKGFCNLLRLYVLCKTSKPTQ
jgi:hypothetical protein